MVTCQKTGSRISVLYKWWTLIEMYLINNCFVNLEIMENNLHLRNAYFGHHLDTYTHKSHTYKLPKYPWKRYKQADLACTMYSPSTLSAFHVCLRWICTSVTWNRRTLWYTCIDLCDVVTITASAYCYLLTIHYHVHVNQVIYFNYIFLVVIFICQFTSLISDWTGLMFIYGYVCLCFVRLLFVHIEYSCHVTHVSNIYTITEDLSYYCTCIISHPTDTTWLMSCTLSIACM